MQKVLQRMNDQGGELVLFFPRSCRAQATPQLLLQGSCSTLCLCPMCSLLSGHMPCTCPALLLRWVPASAWPRNNMGFLQGRASAQTIWEQIPNTEGEIISVASHVLCPSRYLLGVKNNVATIKSYRLCWEFILPLPEITFMSEITFDNENKFVLSCWYI